MGEDRVEWKIYKKATMPAVSRSAGDSSPRLTFSDPMRHGTLAEVLQIPRKMFPLWWLKTLKKIQYFEYLFWLTQLIHLPSHVERDNTRLFGAERSFHYWWGSVSSKHNWKSCQVLLCAPSPIRLTSWNVFSNMTHRQPRQEMVRVWPQGERGFHLVVRQARNTCEISRGPR